MLRVNAINRQELLKCLTFNPKSLVFKTVSVPSMLLSGGRADFLKDHQRFAEDITNAVEQLENML